LFKRLLDNVIGAKIERVDSVAKSRHGCERNDARGAGMFAKPLQEAPAAAMGTPDRQLQEDKIGPQYGDASAGRVVARQGDDSVTVVAQPLNERVLRLRMTQNDLCALHDLLPS
jgi:hypothetical protein